MSASTHFKKHNGLSGYLTAIFLSIRRLLFDVSPTSEAAGERDELCKKELRTTSNVAKDLGFFDHLEMHASV